MKGLFLDQRRKPNEIAWIKELKSLDKSYKNIEWKVFTDPLVLIEYVQNNKLDFDVISLDFTSTLNSDVMSNVILSIRVSNECREQNFIPKLFRSHSNDSVIQDAVQKCMDVYVDAILEARIANEIENLTGLFLDDERQPSEVTWVRYPDNVQWTVAKNIYEFRRLLQENTYSIVSFDYYLGVGYPNGGDALGLLIELCEEMNYPIPKIVKFHSSARDMADEMTRRWKQWVRDRKSTSD